MATITVWGDESSQNAHKYMVLGTIWENSVATTMLERDILRLKRDTGFNLDKEFHWSKMKKLERDTYKGLVDLFKTYMDQGSLKFRSLVVDMKNRVNIRDDHELHFYKMFFWLIYKRLRIDHTYDIFLDQKNNKVDGRLPDLQKALNNRMHNDSMWKFEQTKKFVRRVEPRDGSQIQLQLADVFAGAIAYVWNGGYQKAKDAGSNNSKVEVVEHIHKQLGLHLRMPHRSAEQEGFNIWNFHRT